MCSNGGGGNIIISSSRSRKRYINSGVGQVETWMSVCTCQGLPFPFTAVRVSGQSRELLEKPHDSSQCGKKGRKWKGGIGKDGKGRNGKGRVVKGRKGKRKEWKGKGSACISYYSLRCHVVIYHTPCHVTSRHSY